MKANLFSHVAAVVTIGIGMLCLSSPMEATIWSADFQSASGTGYNGSPNDFWNVLTTGAAGFGTIATPSWTVKDSTQDLSKNLTLSMTGTIGGTYHADALVNAYPGGVANPIGGDGFYKSSFGATAAESSFTFSGLTANAQYEFTVFATLLSSARAFNIRFFGGSYTTINNYNYFDPPPTSTGNPPVFGSNPPGLVPAYVTFSLTANGSGQITGGWLRAPSATEGNWAGFQLREITTQTPEPSTIIMISLAFGSVLSLSARKRRRETRTI